MPDFIVYIIAISSIVVAIISAHLLTKTTSVSALMDSERRIVTIDGMRGYLALMVFMSHFVATYYWKTTGIWGTDRGPLINAGAAIGVDAFFMITAFLFVGKVLDVHYSDWSGLFISRIFRIYPVYIFAIGIMFVISLVEHVHRISLVALLEAIARWLVFVGGPIGADDNPKIVIAGVHWTLRYELVFYIMLPLVALVIRSSKAISATFCVVLFIISALSLHVSKFSSVYLFNFIVGGIGAYLWKYSVRLPRFPNASGESLLACALLVVAFLLSSKPLLQEIALGIAFTKIVYGEDLFGVLRLKGSIFLGDISYSVYLVHGIVLYAIFSCAFPGFASQYPPYAYFALMPFITLLVVGVGFMSFRLVEMPWIAVGQSIRRRRSRPDEVVLRTPA